MRSKHKQLFGLAMRDLLVGSRIIADRLGRLEGALTITTYHLKAVEFLLN